MKFCKYCGKQLEDHETCTCQNVQETNSPYAVQSNKQPSEFGKKLGMAFKNMPMAFKSFWQGPDNIVNIAIKEKDILLSSVYSAIFFLATLLYNVFLILSLQTGIDKYTDIPLLGGLIDAVEIFNFGKILLTSIVMTILVGGLYVLLEGLINLVVCKKDAKSAFLNAFITFSIKSIPVSILFVLGGILSFASLTGSATQSTKMMLIVNLAVVIAVAICVFVAVKLLVWNCDISSATSALGDYSDYFGDFY